MSALDWHKVVNVALDELGPSDIERMLIWERFPEIEDYRLAQELYATTGDTEHFRKLITGAAKEAMEIIGS